MTVNWRHEFAVDMASFKKFAVIFSLFVHDFRIGLIITSQVVIRATYIQLLLLLFFSTLRPHVSQQDPSGLLQHASAGWMTCLS